MHRHLRQLGYITEPMHHAPFLCINMKLRVRAGSWQRRSLSYRSSLDEPVQDRPPLAPRARAAPSPSHEEPSLGQSRLLLTTQEEVSEGCIALSLGLGYTRHQVHRWAWAPRTQGARSRNAQNEPLPSDPGCFRVGKDLTPLTAELHWLRTQNL